jgi:uncharacterized membrane protein YdbT with pleckstrin-like domain
VASGDGLAEGEQLVLRLHPHARTMIRPAAILFLIVAAASALVFVLPAHTSALWTVRAAIGAAALVAAIIWVGVPFLRWRTTVYEVTTRRLRLREGILSRSGRDFPLNRISDVSFSQSVVDRIFGCGRLIVESPGEQGQLVLREIPNVKEVQGILFGLVEDEGARIVRGHPAEE